MLWAHNAPETTRHDSFIHFTKYISTLFLFSQLAIPFTVSFSLYQSSGPFVFGNLLCRCGTFLLLASANFHVCLYILLFRPVNTNIMSRLDTKKGVKWHQLWKKTQICESSTHLDRWLACTDQGDLQLSWTLEKSRWRVKMLRYSIGKRRCSLVTNNLIIIMTINVFSHKKGFGSCLKLRCHKY